jgi:hypothetical protein
MVSCASLVGQTKVMEIGARYRSLSKPSFLAGIVWLRDAR